MIDETGIVLSHLHLNTRGIPIYDTFGDQVKAKLIF